MSVACSLRDAAHSAALPEAADAHSGAPPAAAAFLASRLEGEGAHAAAWARLVAEGGVLDALAHEQQGELCGPKPTPEPRPAFGAEGPGAAVAGGQGGAGEGVGPGAAGDRGPSMSTSDVMALLRSLRMGN